MATFGFFDFDERCAQLKQAGNPLVQLHDNDRIRGLSSDSGPCSQEGSKEFIRTQSVRCRVFDEDLIAAGFVAQKGGIVDARIVEAPRQRHPQEENTPIKAGSTPASFTDNPCKHRQKDTDAPWLTKNKVRHFGDKNHANVDVKYKLIRKYAVTDASVHDSQLIETLLDEKNAAFRASGDNTTGGRFKYFSQQ